MSDRSTGEVRVTAGGKSLRRGLAGASLAALGVAMMGGAALAQPAAGPAPEANQPSTPNPATNTSPENAPVAPTNAPEAPPAQPAPVSQVPVASQSATGTTQVQAVVITGSRIARKDYTSDSPIVTLNNQALTNTANVQVEQSLNKLPQFTPDQDLTGVNSGDVQPNPEHSVGIATVSLRGLGPNRNLVLVDGRRAPPVNGELVVDVNNIPAALIDHVETVTGGASATYGADAVGGVVNFILKKNFRGLDIDAQDSIDQAGDNNQFNASIVMGTNFADDKGNVTVALERFQSNPAFQKDHSFFTKGWSDPTVGPNAFFQFGGGWGTVPFLSPGSPSAAAVEPTAYGGAPNSIFAAGTEPYGINLGPGFTAPGIYPISIIDGQAVAGGEFFSYLPGLNYNYPKNLINGTTAAYYNVLNPDFTVGQGIKNNATNGYITSPLDRWSMFLQGHYDINDDLSVFVQGGFTQTTTNTVLTAPASFIDGWNLNMPYGTGIDPGTVDAATGATLPQYVGVNGCPAAGGCTNTQLHPVPAALAQALNSRGTPNAPWDVYWLPSPNGPLPPRGSQDQNEVFQLTTGLDGKVPNTDWTYELYASHSQSTERFVLTGDYSLTRYQDLVTQPNWGAGATLTGNESAPDSVAGVPYTIVGAAGQTVTVQPSTRPGFGTEPVHCTSGFYNAIFYGAGVSADCLYAITATLQDTDVVQQDVVEFDIQGGLFQLPAGQLRFSAGADYRRDGQQYLPDNLQSTASFADQVVGVYPAPPVNASIDVTEGYGELSVPVLGNLPFVKSLTLNPGLRYSSYDASPGGLTYKLLADWQVNDWIRFRGGYNLAVRAPNPAELFQGNTYNYGAGFLHADPCSLEGDSQYGANGSTYQAPAGAGGVPAPVAKVTNVNGVAGANSTYNICQALMGTKNAAGQLSSPGVDPTATESAAAAQFYGLSTGGGTATDTGGLSFGFLNESGNPNLQPEKARTWTAGIVLRSPLQSALFSRIQVSLDWYELLLNHAISFETEDYAYDQCLNQSATTQAELAAALASAGCQGILRSSEDGSELLTTIPEANLATIETDGVDMQLDWSFRVADVPFMSMIPGQFSMNLVGNYLDHYFVKPDPLSPNVDFAGTAGPTTFTGVDMGQYRWKLNTTFGYTLGPLSLSMDWRHLPSIHPASYATTGKTNNASLDTPSFDIFDLHAIWQLNHLLQVRAGIDNLLDTDPAITGATTDTYLNGHLNSLGTDGQGTTNSQYYPSYGRQFYVGLKARF